MGKLGWTLGLSNSTGVGGEDVAAPVSHDELPFLGPGNQDSAVAESEGLVASLSTSQLSVHILFKNCWAESWVGQARRMGLLLVWSGPSQPNGVLVGSPALGCDGGWDHFCLRKRHQSCHGESACVSNSCSVSGIWSQAAWVQVPALLLTSQVIWLL